MLKNCFKNAWRSIFRHKWYALQSIVGLAAALTLLLLCLVYATHEFRFDRHHKNAERIYRVNTDLRLEEQEKKSANSSDVIGPLWKDFSQVEAYTRIFQINEFSVKKGDIYLKESNGAYVDSAIFNIFDFPIISRSNVSLLAKPNTVVITGSIAKKYFGDENAAGKVIEIENLSHGKKENGRYMVAAVIADHPKTSSLTFDFLFPSSDLEYAWGVNYAGAYFSTFVLLKAGADYQALNEQFKEVTKSKIYPIASRQFALQNEGWESFKRAGNRLEFTLFPLTSIHLHSHREGELGQNSKIQTLYILGALALFALLMGIVNFVNLSTARVMERAGEIGVRKVLGSSRGVLIMQILVEVVILLFISLTIAFIQAVAMLPYVNDTLRTYLNVNDFLSLRLLAMVLGATILVGFLAGCYPALYYAGIKPLTAMKTKNGLKGKGVYLRKGLIVFQFSIAILLLIATFVTYHQLRYIQQKDLGYEQEGILVVQNIRSLNTQRKVFKENVLAIPGVTNGSLTGSLPVNSSKMEGNFSATPNKDQAGAIPLRNWWIDEDYLPTMGIELIEGKNFSEIAQHNFKSVIINEKAAMTLGLDDPVNATIFTDDSTGYMVTGIIKDFNFESLHQAIGPLLLNYSTGEYADLAVFRFEKNTNLNRLIEEISKVWEKVASTSTPDFYFLDDALNEVYWDYHATLKTGLSVAILAILIACIGLLGMITYITQQRVKEIGIRKVLGASVAGIVRMLSSDFIKLVLLAILIASPIAWWAMSSWLQDFAYRIEIQWWMFAVAGSAAVLIALLTVSWQAIRAAVANPVESLRDE